MSLPKTQATINLSEAQVSASLKVDYRKRYVMLELHKAGTVDGHPQKYALGTTPHLHKNNVTIFPT